MWNKFLLLCLFFFPLISSAFELKTIEIKENKSTQIIFKGDIKDPRVFTLQHPDRLVVDFEKTQLKMNLAHIALQQKSPIEKIREGFPKKDVLRIVFDLKNPQNFTRIQNAPFLTFELSSLNKNKNGISPVQSRETYVKPNRLVIVIDPGHGGKDPGAIGDHGTKEKDVVLDIAKKLARLINQHPRMHAVLTRDGDYYISLSERLALARKNKADLFIAIHADSYFNKHANGASVYSLSDHGASSMAARWLANRENHSELGGVDFGELGDQSIQLRSVLIDLAKTQTIKDSLLWGTSILGSLDDVTRLHYRTVERAPFLVLKSPDIPSILVETGFISNQNEEKRLRDHDHQHKIALALYNGIRGYWNGISHKE